MGDNNWKDLEESYQEGSEENVDRAKKKVTGIVSFFHLIGDIFDLYLPKVASFFIAASGGEAPDNNQESKRGGGRDTDPENSKYPHENF